MAGILLARELTRSRVEFAVATREDDAEIRALLRNTPMAGHISVTLERESDYFADDQFRAETKQTIVARERGQIVCVGNCAIREMFVNGALSRVGYLGGLRLASSHSGRFDILRRGYEFFCELQADDPADFYFTAIASDNHRARSFLERAPRSMPRYEFVSDYASVIVRSKRGNLAPAQKVAVQQRVDRQFAPVWPDDIGFLEFVSVENAVAALWDQRSFKQTVVRGYSGWLRYLRPLLQIPRVGEVLSNAFVFGLKAADANSLLHLVRALRGCAAAREIDFITFGFGKNDPLLAEMLKKVPCRAYWSRIYVVNWPGIGGHAVDLDGRIVSPEVALL